MSKFHEGDLVTAIKDIGGVIRERVPKGAGGVVVKGGWTNRARVRFKFHSWGEKVVEIEVDDDEIF